MKIAIIGAGYSGLAACHYLLQAGCFVTLFDEKGIGGGASGVSTGLLHPFPGEKMRRSRHADIAMKESKALLCVAQEALGKPLFHAGGITRVIHDPQLAEEVKRREDPDLIWKEENVCCITSGMIVFSTLYLKGLSESCFQKGAKFEQRKISDLNELQEFDHILVTAGAGSLALLDELKSEVSLIKGQVLSARVEKLDKSLIGKGYIAMREEKGLFHLGSTYERGFLSEEPCEEFAKREILTKIAKFYPAVVNAVIEGCRAGVRVARKGDYLPILRRIDERVSVITAMGSRGLLYHAYYGKLFKNLLLG
jgi:glycine/D-amino acid oxidase-like deaminating enzyme